MTAMTNREASVSTFGKTGASRTSYCKDVPALDDDTTLLFDFMDPNYQRAVSNLPTIGAVGWKAKASLTSLSFDYYGTTDHWQTILAYNGYVSASHIPAGATINMPDVSGLKASLQTTNRGRVVRI